MGDENERQCSTKRGDENMKEYSKKLLGDVRMRYNNKIICINNVDPYSLDKNSPFFIQIKDLPKLGYMDVVSYFLSTHSFFTAEKLKCYKTLESYKFCQAGFVREVLAYKIGENFVIVAKVYRFFPFRYSYVKFCLKM